MNITPGLRAALLITLATLMWGGNAVAGKLAVGQISPLSVVFVRWVLVSGFMWLLYGRAVRAHWPKIRDQLPLLILTSVIGFTAFNTLMYYAAHSTTAVNIGILQGSMPIFVLAGARLFYGTRVTVAQSVGVMIALVGVIAVATRGDPASLLALGLNPGDGLMLIACLSYAMYTLALKRRPPMDGAAFFTLLSVIAMLTSIPLIVVDVAAGSFFWPTQTGWMVVAFVAIFPSMLSQLFFLRGVDLVGPGRAGTYVNLVPIWASILGVLILGERFALYHGIGLALVMIGIALTQREARAVSAMAVPEAAKR
ncbi:MAG: DMT family transporter [Burkholderiaceae bacterium]